MDTTATRRPSNPDASASPRARAYWADLRHDLVTAMVELARLNTGEAAAAEAEALRAATTAVPEDLTAGVCSEQIDAMRGTIAYLRREVRAAQAALAREVGAVLADRDARRMRGEAMPGPTDTAADTAADPDGGLVEDRFYLLDGVAYRTKRARAGHLYALVWNADTRKWDFARGISGRLTPAHRLTVEQAEAMSLHLGECIRCHLELRVAESVKAGIGPKCAKKV